jgi:hypothetical protein
MVVTAQDLQAPCPGSCTDQAVYSSDAAAFRFLAGFDHTGHCCDLLIDRDHISMVEDGCNKRTGLFSPYRSLNRYWSPYRVSTETKELVFFHPRQGPLSPGGIF